MVAYKASQTGAFLKTPPAAIRAALLYGPDAGLVADRAATLAATIAGRAEPEAEIVRLDDRDLGEDPGRLAVEAQTLPMFASAKIVRVGAGPRFPAQDLESLLSGPTAAYLIVEAGNLRPASPLRKAFEGSQAAAALPCYELSPREMTAFVRETLEASGVGLEDDAGRHLVSLFGGDQARARAELEKLALYVGEGGRASLADIDAAIGDVARAALDTLAVSAGHRNTREALSQLDRLLATGQSAQGVLTALLRHFERLHRLCAALEAGQPAGRAFARFRPPLHFRLRDALEAQARTWSARDAARALRLVAQAIRTARRRPEFDQAVTERLLIRLGANFV